MRIELSRLRLEIGRKRHLARTFNRLSEGDKSEPKLGSAPYFLGNPLTCGNKKFEPFFD